MHASGDLSETFDIRYEFARKNGIAGHEVIYLQNTVLDKNVFEKVGFSKINDLLSVLKEQQNVQKNLRRHVNIKLVVLCLLMQSNLMMYDCC